MIINFAEKYKDLYEPIQDIPRRKLKVIPGEQRGDDCGSSLYHPVEYSDLSLILIAQKTAPNGFVENYCLEQEETDKLRKIRQRLYDDPLWTENITHLLEQYLPISYREFMELSLEEQQMIIDRIISEHSNGASMDFQQALNNIMKDKPKVRVKKIKRN